MWLLRSCDLKKQMSQLLLELLNLCVKTDFILFCTIRLRPFFAIFLRLSFLLFNVLVFSVHWCLIISVRVEQKMSHSWQKNPKPSLESSWASLIWHLISSATSKHRSQLLLDISRAFFLEMFSTQIIMFESARTEIILNSLWWMLSESIVLNCIVPHDFSPSFFQCLF